MKIFKLKKLTEEIKEFKMGIGGFSEKKYLFIGFSLFFFNGLWGRRRLFR